MDAANIDLKGSEEFYKRLCSAQLGRVLDRPVCLKHETKVWFEITTLLIPGENSKPQHDAVHRKGRTPRDRYKLTEWNLTLEGRCRGCGTACAGYAERWSMKPVLAPAE
jgi:hypothetical protein